MQPPDAKAYHPDESVSRVFIRFEGLKRVSHHTLLSECQSFRYVRSLQDVQLALEDAHARLLELRLFKDLRADVSVKEDGSVDITFVAEERKRGMSVGANADKRGEMTGNLSIEQPALIGGPLSATVSCSQAATSQSVNEFLLRLTTPRFAGRRIDWSFDVARSASDESEGSSYTSQVTHALMKLSLPSGLQSFFVEAALSDLRPSEKGSRFPSTEVLQSRLRSVKTSLKYQCAQTWYFPMPFWCWSTGGLAQNIERPSMGVRANLELAGMAGDSAFWRGECHAGASLPLPWGLSFGCFGAIGLLLPRDGQMTCLQDRFYLGGPSGSTSILKGFGHRGIGPMGLCRPRPNDTLTKKFSGQKRMCDALGGDTMANAFASISGPLPIQQNGGVDARIFGFVGMGSLSLGHRPTFGGIFESLCKDVRASAGIGVGLPLGGNGQLELTLACPMWAQSSDAQQSRQIGLRFSWQS